MGNFFGGGSDAGKTSNTNEPWAGQIPYYQDSLQKGGQLLNSQWGMPYYQGDREAPLSQTQRQYISQAQGLGGAVPQFGDLAQRNAMLASGGLAPAMGLANQYAQGQFGLQGPQGALDSIYQRAGFDPTNEIARRAGIYADNPYLSGQIAGVGRDIQRNLYEDTLPTLNMQAMRGGNLNSSRAGAAEAIAMRGAEDRYGDIASQMRGDAYNQGLGLGADTWQQQFGNQLNATGQAGSLYGTDINSRLSGLGNLGSLIGGGMNAATGAENLAGSRMGGLQTAGGLEQGGAQAGMNNQYNRWLGTMNFPWQQLQNYQAVLGGNLGSQSSGYAPTGQASPFQQFVGAGIGIGGMFL